MAKSRLSDDLPGLEQEHGLARLKANVDKRIVTEPMAPSSVGTYLRFLRRKSGLSQRELARVLGSVTANQISRHERSVTPPTLIAAFAYQAVFQKPASEIFPGLYYTVETVVQERLEALESELGNSTTKGRAAVPVAQQLEWLWERRNPESV